MCPRRAACAVCDMPMPPHIATQCSDVNSPTINSAPRLMPAFAVGKALSNCANGVSVVSTTSAISIAQAHIA